MSFLGFGKRKEAIGDLALFQAKIREIRLAMMDAPTVRPICGGIYVTRNGSVVVCAESGNSDGVPVCIVLQGGHGVHEKRGAKPGEGYALERSGSFCDAAMRGDTMEVHIERMRRAIEGGEEWKHPRDDARANPAKLTDSQLIVHGMDLIGELISPEDLAALASKAVRSE